MSNRQFWAYLGLEFIYKTTFGKLFYQNICEIDEDSKLDYLKFLDFEKFLKFVAIFTKTFKDNPEQTKNLRKKFVFRLFDVDNNEEIDKLEFRNFVNAFIELILGCNFDNKEIQDKKDEIINSVSNLSRIEESIEKSIDAYVDDVFSGNTFDGYVMTYGEWEGWINQVEGIKEILNYPLVK